MSAAALRAEAAASDLLAARFDAEASRLPTLLEPVIGRMGPDVWRGPAAEDLAAAARSWRGRLESEAGVLRTVARRLRERAQQLRDEAQRVEQAEAEAAAEAVRLAEEAARQGPYARVR